MRNEQNNEVLRRFLVPFFRQMKKLGIKSCIERMMPGFYINDFIIKKVKKSLRLVKSIDLGRFLGKINIYYKSNSIFLDFVGLIGLFINQITISNEKIIEISQDIFGQIEDVFLDDEDYFIRKIDNILHKLSRKERVIVSDTKDKSIYDFIIMVLFYYYNSIESDFPDWFKEACKNLKRTEFAKDFLNFFIEILISTFNEISKNIYVNYEILFASRVVKFFLNKNTNKGKLSEILLLFNIDLRQIINKFVKDYAGPTFLKGLGEHLSCIVQDLVVGVSENINYKNLVNRFNFTSCFGENINSRRFRWFGNNETDEYLEISENEDFSNSVMVKAQREKILLSRPTILDLGTIAKYQIEPKMKYSVKVSNFKPNREYFIRIKRNIGSYINKFVVKNNDSCDFVVMADSQGMIKKDYDVFINAFETIVSEFKNLQFISHLGDFVDEGYNENYWDLLLESKYWGKIPIFPLVGNHESKFHPTLKHAGISNSIVNHFNVEIPGQDDLNKGFYYSFEQNDCIYIFINTNLYGGLGRKQLKWINFILENSNAKWKILFTHKSPYSIGPHFDDSDIEFIKKEINGLCLKFNIDIVFGGHDHVYSRTKPICFGKQTEENKDGKTFINPSGTIFVTVGPIGVKNYNSCCKKSIIEYSTYLDSPSFAHVTIKNNTLRVKVFEFFNEKKFDIIDEFCIRKDDQEYSKPEKIEQCINNYPIIPWVCSYDRANDILRKYSMLDKDDKKSVDIQQLNSIIKQNLAYKRILEGNISIVDNKYDFFKSLDNPDIKTIVIQGETIKFENKFGFGRKVKINRDLFIKGNAKLKFISFILKPNISLYIGENIIIDNNRKKFSIFPSICSFVLKGNNSLIFQDNIWVEQSYGFCIKKKKIVKFGDVNSNVFINSENFKHIPKNFVRKQNLSNVFSIFD